uniref:Uncharacterized protein n=1 Tax=Lactuca sativa TaxID=4236 RepID=A0A9R1V131_LACSA|nr:hypothetical protein LSAT_V11C700361690 [Lactuca sativa]
MTSDSSVMDHFGENFDRYVQVQETKAEMITWMKQKMNEAQTSFQEAQEMLQTKTDMKILKMKADDLDDEDLELFLAMKELIRVQRRNRGWSVVYNDSYPMVSDKECGDDATPTTILISGGYNVIRYTHH